MGKKIPVPADSMQHNASRTAHTAYVYAKHLLNPAKSPLRSILKQVSSGPSCPCTSHAIVSQCTK